MNRHCLHFVSGTLLVLLAGCAEPRPDGSPQGKFSDLTDPARAPSAVQMTNSLSPELLRASTNIFRLGPGDRLEIEVPGQPTSRAEATVGPDGKIYWYLLPGLDVWGLSIKETQQLLERELGKYLTSPHVSVSLREVASQHVWLLGRLNRPGVYPLTGSMSLIESLALAGGPARSLSQISSAELADLRHSFVMRQGQMLPVNFYRLLREGDLSQNIMLEPDDFVFIPSLISQEVYVLGAVRAPRAVPYTEEMTLVSALAGGGGEFKWDFLTRSDSGLLKDAYLSHVAIVRGSLAEPQVMVVDAGAILKGKAPNVPLEAGDIVFVPNSPYRYLKSYVNMIVNTFVSTVAANEGLRAGGGGQVGISVPVGK